MNEFDGLQHFINGAKDNPNAKPLTLETLDKMIEACEDNEILTDFKYGSQRLFDRFASNIRSDERNLIPTAKTDRPNAIYGIPISYSVIIPENEFWLIHKGGKVCAFVLKDNEIVKWKIFQLPI